jgi:nitric oxide reductase subunit B
MKTRNLWISFILVMVVSFGILGYYGIEIYRQAPPIPEKVVTTDGKVIMTATEIKDGQNVWQSMGGQEVGTVWGHGAYQAPDWTADWLHREAIFMLNEMSMDEYGIEYENANDEQKALLEMRLQKEMRKNTYDEQTGTTTISPLRSKAFENLSKHYRGLFMDDPQFEELRDAYAIPPNSIKGEERMAWMNAFFFWATWSTVTERPGQEITYTNNWPPEKLVGNEPTGTLL